MAEPEPEPEAAQAPMPSVEGKVMNIVDLNHTDDMTPSMRPLARLVEEVCSLSHPFYPFHDLAKYRF